MAIGRSDGFLLLPPATPGGVGSGTTATTTTTSTSELFMAGFGGGGGGSSKSKKKKSNKSTPIKLKPKLQWDRYQSFKKENKVRVGIRDKDAGDSAEWLEVGRVKSKENQHTVAAVALQRAIIAEVSLFDDRRRFRLRSGFGRQKIGASFVEGSPHLFFC